ncbi:nucleotidyltransferase family protein [Desertihabitans aurantiacus]|uniref:nucleotidyltransferase family protein n=1 Tax=Desertihabitans aurantiacus TaxID=2282477 RepID=UPI000DF7F008|nr:nucleotidyltransferase family protein [Desertihabitans aurantiacus]
MSSDPETEPGLRAALRSAASALKSDGVPFALTGGYALWVHGAPEPTHDVDFAVPEDEVERAAESLAAAGFEVERPPEDWLFKAHRDGAMVDVLHRLQGHPVDSLVITASGEQEILGLRIPVMPPTQIMAAKLGSLSEHYCDLAPLLGVARAVREQLDWGRLRDEAHDQPFAEAFLLLTDRLGISGPASG